MKVAAIDGYDLQPLVLPPVGRSQVDGTCNAQLRVQHAAYMQQTTNPIIDMSCNGLVGACGSQYKSDDRPMHASQLGWSRFCGMTKHLVGSIPTHDVGIQHAAGGAIVHAPVS